MKLSERAFQLEYNTARDFFYDFCLWEYRPLTSPENKLSSVNLLYNSFEAGRVSERFFDSVGIIRRGFGFSKTVWGVKNLGGDIGWEFYFYDYKRRERERSVSRFIDIIRPLARCGIEINENLHYFMFSIDVDEDLLSAARELDEIHLYIGNPGSTVSSGICYSLTKVGTRLENFYFFFDAKNQQKDIVVKAMTSAHLDTTRVVMDRVIRPELRDCNVIVVANKQGNDAIYFSRINVDQLILFLKQLGYPEEIVSFAEEKRNLLDHLLFDAGFDYRMIGGDLEIIKSGYYGFF
jgi:hypothetical protein